MKNIVFVTAIATSALADCASPNTGIVQIADDTYIYGKQEANDEMSALATKLTR